MKALTWKGMLALLGLTAALLLVFAACGEEESEKPMLVFSDLDWPSAQLQNAIARASWRTATGTRRTPSSAGRCRCLRP